MVVQSGVIFPTSMKGSPSRVPNCKPAQPTSRSAPSGTDLFSTNNASTAQAIGSIRDLKAPRLSTPCKLVMFDSLISDLDKIGAKLAD